MPLARVFKNIAEKAEGKEAISHKESAAKLTEYFGEVLPDFDQERVYASNIKKVIQWYNTLAQANFDFSTLVEAEETTAEEA